MLVETKLSGNNILGKVLIVNLDYLFLARFQQQKKQKN